MLSTRSSCGAIFKRDLAKAKAVDGSFTRLADGLQLQQFMTLSSNRTRYVAYWFSSP